MKKYIPNFFTSLNLTCGCIAILLLLKDNYNATVIFCLLAFLFDFSTKNNHWYSTERFGSRNSLLLYIPKKEREEMRAQSIEDGRRK